VTGRRMLEVAFGHAQAPPAVLIPRGESRRPNPPAIFPSDDARPDMAAVEERIRAKGAEAGARLRAAHREMAAQPRRGGQPVSELAPFACPCCGPTLETFASAAVTCRCGRRCSPPAHVAAQRKRERARARYVAQRGRSEPPEIAKSPAERVSAAVQGEAASG
jgi:hypothetical protein